MRRVTAFLVAVMLATAICSAESVKLLKSDFETDPVAAGWTRNGAMTPANWQETVGHNGGHCMFVDDGDWESPLFPVTTFSYYKCTFWTRVEPRPFGTVWPEPAAAPSTPEGYPAYWAAMSFDPDKNPLAADHYWSVDLSSGWQEHDYVTYSKANSGYMSVRFQPVMNTPMWIDDVTVEPVDYQYVAEWIDAQYAGMPQFNFTAPKNRWKYIPKTMAKLKNGGTIRVVMLGDSICNDTGNSQWHALVQRMYPGTKLEVVTSVRGGTGNVWYQQDNHVKDYVIDYKPDLLIIAGISQDHDVEAARNVFRQVRAKIDPEIMFMTPVIGPDDPCKPGPNDAKDAEFTAAMKNVCREEKVEFVDMMTPWRDYVCSSGKGVEWFHRDLHHANMRGAIVLAKTIEAYFAPKPKM